VQVPEAPSTKRVALVFESTEAPNFMTPPVAVTVKDPQAMGDPTVVTGQARLVVGVSVAVPIPPMVPVALTLPLVPPSVREIVSVVDSVPALEEVGAKVMVPEVHVWPLLKLALAQVPELALKFGSAKVNGALERVTKPVAVKVIVPHVLAAKGFAVPHDMLVGEAPSVPGVPVAVNTIAEAVPPTSKGVTVVVTVPTAAGLKLIVKVVTSLAK